MTTNKLLLGLLFSTAITGCTAGSSDGLDPGETVDTAASGKADSTALQTGTYDFSPEFDGYKTMTLGMDSVVRLDGDASFLGNFKLTKTSTYKALRIYSGSDDDGLLVKFKYTLDDTGANLTDTADGSTYAAGLEGSGPAPLPSAVLGGDIGSGELDCQHAGGDPASFVFFVDHDAIVVTATNTSGGTYSVDDAELTSTDLKLTLSNTVDGPLSQDVISLPLAGLSALASSAATIVSGTDTYSEQYDGTTQHFTLACSL